MSLLLSLSLFRVTALRQVIKGAHIEARNLPKKMRRLFTRGFVEDMEGCTVERAVGGSLGWVCRDVLYNHNHRV